MAEDDPTKSDGGRKRTRDEVQHALFEAGWDLDALARAGDPWAREAVVVIDALLMASDEGLDAVMQVAAAVRKVYRPKPIADLTQRVPPRLLRSFANGPDGLSDTYEEIAAYAKAAMDAGVPLQRNVGNLLDLMIHRYPTVYRSPKDAAFDTALGRAMKRLGGKRSDDPRRIAAAVLNAATGMSHQWDAAKRKAKSRERAKTKK